MAETAAPFSDAPVLTPRHSSAVVTPLLPMGTVQAATFLKYCSDRIGDTNFERPGSDGKFTGAAVTRDGNLVTANTAGIPAEAIVYDPATGTATTYPITGAGQPRFEGRDMPEIHAFDLSGLHAAGKQVYAVLGGDKGDHAKAIADTLNADKDATLEQIRQAVGGDGSAVVKATRGPSLAVAVFKGPGSAEASQEFQAIASSTVSVDMQGAQNQSANLSRRSGRIGTTVRSVVPASAEQYTLIQLGELVLPKPAPPPQPSPEAKLVHAMELIQAALESGTVKKGSGPFLTGDRAALEELQKGIGRDAKLIPYGTETMLVAREDRLGLAIRDLPPAQGAAAGKAGRDGRG